MTRRSARRGSATRSREEPDIEEPVNEVQPGNESDERHEDREEADVQDERVEDREEIVESPREGEPSPESTSGPQTRLIIERLELHNFKSYAGTKVIGPFHKVIHNWHSSR